MMFALGLQSPTGGATPPPNPIFGIAMSAYCSKGKKDREQFYAGITFKKIEVTA